MIEYNNFQIKRITHYRMFYQPSYEIWFDDKPLEPKIYSYYKIPYFYDIRETKKYIDMLVKQEYYKIKIFNKNLLKELK